MTTQIPAPAWDTQSICEEISTKTERSLNCGLLDTPKSLCYGQRVLGETTPGGTAPKPLNGREGPRRLGGRGTSDVGLMPDDSGRMCYQDQESWQAAKRPDTLLLYPYNAQTAQDVAQSSDGLQGPLFMMASWPS